MKKSSAIKVSVAAVGNVPSEDFQCEFERNSNVKRGWDLAPDVRQEVKLWLHKRGLNGRKFDPITIRKISNNKKHYQAVVRFL